MGYGTSDIITKRNARKEDGLIDSVNMSLAGNSLVGIEFTAKEGQAFQQAARMLAVSAASGVGKISITSKDGTIHNTYTAFVSGTSSTEQIATANGKDEITGNDYKLSFGIKPTGDYYIVNGFQTSSFTGKTEPVVGDVCFGSKLTGRTGRCATGSFNTASGADMQLLSQNANLVIGASTADSKFRELKEGSKGLVYNPYMSNIHGFLGDGDILYAAQYISTTAPDGTSDVNSYGISGDVLNLENSNVFGGFWKPGGDAYSRIFTVIDQTGKRESRDYPALIRMSKGETAIRNYLGVGLLTLSSNGDGSGILTVGGKNDYLILPVTGYTSTRTQLQDLTDAASFHTRQNPNENFGLVQTAQTPIDTSTHFLLSTRTPQSAPASS